MRLKEKVAIVTGGATGIGAAYCRGFADEGAKIVIADINLEVAKTDLDDYEKMGVEVLSIRTDVSDPDSTREMASKTVERFGRIDILVNNAAMLYVAKISRDIPFYELDLDDWDRVMAVNVKGALLCARAVFPYMKAQGKGKIINISSGLFYTGGGDAKYVHYVASKGAVIGLTRALARELGEYNINVNCISPGYTITNQGTDQASIEFANRQALRRCIKRVEHPQDLVGTAIFLASSDSDFITGQNIMVNGGAEMM